MNKRALFGLLVAGTVVLLTGCASSDGWRNAGMAPDCLVGNDEGPTGPHSLERDKRCDHNRGAESTTPRSEPSKVDFTKRQN